MFGVIKRKVIETVLLSSHNIRFGREKRKLILITHSLPRGGLGYCTFQKAREGSGSRLRLSGKALGLESKGH